MGQTRFLSPRAAFPGLCRWMYLPWISERLLREHFASLGAESMFRVRLSMPHSRMVRGSTSSYRTFRESTGRSISGSSPHHCGEASMIFGGPLSLLLSMALVLGASSFSRGRRSDGAAVFASESFDPTAVSKQGSRVRAPLTSYRVRQSAEEFLETVGSQDLTMVVLESAHTPDGWHAEVGLSSLWSPPVVSHFLPTTLRIQVEARAQTFLR